MKASITFACPTCSVRAGERCISVGRLQNAGAVMMSYHVARRRLVRIAFPVSGRGFPSERRNADRIDGYDRDDIPGGGDR